MMKINNLLKFYIIIFLIFCLVFLPTFSFADDTPSVSFDYTYNYKVTNSSLLNEVLEDAFNSDYVYSGNYYYFAFLARNYNDNTVSPKVFYVSKSGLKSFTFTPEFILCGGYYSFKFKWTCGVRSDWESPNSGYSGFIKPNGYVCTMYPVALWDSNVHTFTMPFVTNYDKDINLTFSNSSTGILLHSTPYISDDDYTIANMSGSYFLINPGNSTVNTLHFSLCQTVTEDLGDDMQYEKEVILKDIVLNTSPPYYHSDNGEVYWWEVPYSSFYGLTLNAGEIYNWRLQYDNGTDTIYVDRKIKSNIDYTFLPPDGGSSGEGDVEDGKDDALQNAINNGTSAIIDSNKQTQNAIQNQTEAIQENTETNKGIWETIKGIFDFLNPLSENFFVYKFLELFVEAMKAIFIPSNEFLSSFFSDLSTWFSDRLGFLWSPFDVTIQVLNKIVNINFSNPIIYIPDINEPFTNTKLISSYTFRFNDLLINDDFSNVYDVYLLVCDAIIYLGLMILAYKKIKEVFKG